MMVVLNYDQTTGQVEDANGAYVGCLHGLAQFSGALTNTSADNAVKMYNGGIPVHDIIQLMQSGVI